MNNDPSTKRKPTGIPEICGDICEEIDGGTVDARKRRETNE